MTEKPCVVLLDDDKVLALYPEYQKVCGPYTSKQDGRQRITLVGRDDTNRAIRRTVSFPKALLETSIGRRLSDGETADHIDENFENNQLTNLQVLTRAQNAIKSHFYGASTAQHLIDYSKSDEGRVKSSERMSGDNNVNSKLNNDEVPILRYKYVTGELTKKEICNYYDITRKAVENMLSGRSYTNCEGPVNMAPIGQRIF